MRRSGNTVDSSVKVNWSIIRELIPFLKEYQLRIAFALLCLILAKLSTIVMPFALKYMVDILGNSETTGSVEVPAYLPEWVMAPFALVIAYGFFRFSNVLFGELRDTIFSRVTERAIRRVSLKVFRHLHALDIGFHLNRRTGGLARDIERGTHGINFLMRFMVFNIIPTIIEISMVISILLTQYGLWFGLVTFGSVICYGIFTVLVTNWRNKYIRAANDADSASSTRAIDSLLNYETVKYFTNEDYEARRYDVDLSVWENAKLKNRFSLFALNAGQALIISLAITALMYLTVHNVIKGNMSVGDLVLVNAFMMQLFMPLNFLGFVYREIRTALVNIENMFTLLHKKPAIVDPEKEELLKSTDPLPIRFNNVSFSYHHDRPILIDISFDIKAQQTVAIVGSSGAGKSTIAKLLLRFYDPTNGVITIGQQNIKKITQNSLRSSIGVVPQDAVLFNDTIYQNILYGNPGATRQEVENAIRMAHLSHFIEQLPDGLETLVGERGLKLSGGEKQRVAIARALLKKPPIMIFDEATSSLDSESEQAILEAIKEITGQYTSLVIAHRLSTIIQADKIIVMDKGRVIESGTHSELVALDGRYAQLWNAQRKQGDHEK
ncbi:ABC transporter ATP-binding protein/permease [Aliikangiella sp. G2MR2-5]|uniref:ABCB family ABC transporter ATP-binding protein/permease n=1 Tax=Aliikangiella sp. G2MR2-5 TaxID=2788943 RepID=UPI0018AC7DDC|nr:ABC transporter ATP-binding protein/permease [Aliikangiella sp. G2MR2-5]